MILEVNGIHTYYGTSHILFGISLSIEEGEAVCLLGRNGVGKTTTLRSIMGLTTPKSGSIRFNSQEIRGNPPYKNAELGIGYVFDDRRIIPDFTVRDNLLLGERPSTGEGWTIEKVYTLFPQLQKLEKRLGGKLSGGEQQMLNIGRTLMCNPRFLLLDEPREGLSPMIGQELLRQLLELRKECITMLFAEQNLQFIYRLSDRVYILEKGAIQYHGSVEDLKNNEEVKAKFLT